MHAAMSPNILQLLRKTYLDFLQRNPPACRAKLKPCDAACLQTALSANVLYYFVVDGFNGAAGTVCSVGQLRVQMGVGIPAPAADLAAE